MNPFVTQKVRTPACAGRFYPADPSGLRRMLRSFLNDVNTAEEPAPKAIIVPHAGYLHSGPVAASAYARLESARDVVKRVVLIGPSHCAEFSGLATTSADAFATPLGPVPLDKEALIQIRSLPQVIVFDEAHEPEHCLEVQLPFLQIVLDEFAIVPLLVGEATDEEITETLAALWNGPGTRIVVSSDLSHYHDFAAVQTIDRATARLIEGLRAEELVGEQACGFLPIRGLLRLARERGLNPQCVDLRSSGDTADLRDRVVGYGAFTFPERD